MKPQLHPPSAACHSSKKKTEDAPHSHATSSGPQPSRVPNFHARLPSPQTEATRHALQAMRPLLHTHQSIKDQQDSRPLHAHSAAPQTKPHSHRHSTHDDAETTLAPSATWFEEKTAEKKQ